MQFTFVLISFDEAIEKKILCCASPTVIHWPRRFERWCDDLQRCMAEVKKEFTQMPAGMFVHAKTENVPLIDKLPVQSKKDAIRQLAIPSWQYRPLNEDAIDGIMNLTYKAGPTDGN